MRPRPGGGGDRAAVRRPPAVGDNVLAKAANISRPVDESGQLAATLGVREVLGELQQLTRALR